MKKDSGLKRNIHLINLKAEKALKKAVEETIRDHARTGDPVVIWRNGKVAWIQANRLLRKKARKS